MRAAGLDVHAVPQFGVAGATDSELEAGQINLERRRIPRWAHVVPPDIEALLRIG